MGDALDGFSQAQPPLSLSSTGGMGDEAPGLHEGDRWGTVSPTERGMTETIGAYEQAMRRAFGDLSVVYTNASALKGSKERLNTLGHAVGSQAICRCLWWMGLC